MKIRIHKSRLKNVCDSGIEMFDRYAAGDDMIAIDLDTWSPRHTALFISLYPDVFHWLRLNRQIPRPNFEGANLSNISFKKANLEKLSFVGANLTGCDFEGANLRGCVMRTAKIDGANFNGANLEGVIW